MSLQISRSLALSKIPQRKITIALEDTLRSCEKCKKGAKLNTSCHRCNMINSALSRYAESNIPIRYWKLEFDENFKGDPTLKKTYEEIVTDLDKTYRDGRCICFAGSFGIGKQICLETELPTPQGFVKLKDLKKGDVLFDECGNECKVVQLHPIQYSPESYEITFDDGAKIKACADHRWKTWTVYDRKHNLDGTVKTTKEILNTIKKYGITNHSIINSKPINYKKKELLIDPYVLGCWLGDGASARGHIECADNQILDEIKRTGYEVKLCKSTLSKDSSSNEYRIGKIIRKNIGKNKNSSIGRLTYELKKLDVLNNKHIPEEYLYGSFEQRLSLVQGLLDTDGSCAKNGLIEFSSCLKILAEQFCQLIMSLGLKAKVNKHKSYFNGKQYKDRFRVTFTTDLPVFRLERKLKRLKPPRAQKNRTRHRYIVSIKKIEPIPMRCISVDSSSHLFLVTRNYIPTHNTFVTSTILKRACEKGYSSLYVTLNDIVSAIISEDKAIARRELLMVDFLVIDEFDPRHISDSQKSFDLFGRTLEDIFRSRAQNMLPTFFCTNSVNVTEMFLGSLKQSMGSLMNYTTIIPILGKDLRKEGL